MDLQQQQAAATSPFSCPHSGHSPLRDCGLGFRFGFGFDDDAFACRNSRMRSGASSCWPDYAHDMLIYMQARHTEEALVESLSLSPVCVLSVVGARRGSLIDIWQLATGKRQQKYVVSTSNRVVINFECGAPTKKQEEQHNAAR